MGRSRAPQAARSTHTKTLSRAVGAASPGGFREELYEWIMRPTSQKQGRDVWVDCAAHRPHNPLIQNNEPRRRRGESWQQEMSQTDRGVLERGAHVRSA